MSEALKYNRRRFLVVAAVTIAAAKVVGVDSAYAQSSNTKAADLTTTKPEAIKVGTSFGPLRQIDAGVLRIGFAEAGRTLGNSRANMHTD